MRKRIGRMVRVLTLAIIAALCFSVFAACGEVATSVQDLKINMMVATWGEQSSATFNIELKDKFTGEKKTIETTNSLLDLKPITIPGREYSLSVASSAAKADTKLATIDFKALNVLEQPSITVSNNVVKWEAVRGATGYRIQYGDKTVNLMEIDRGIAIGKEVPTEYLITPKDEITCEISVTALGDGIMYADSAESDKLTAKLVIVAKMKKVENLRVATHILGNTSLLFEAQDAAKYVAVINDAHFDVDVSDYDGETAIIMDFDKLVNYHPGSYKVSVYSKALVAGQWQYSEKSDEVIVTIAEPIQMNAPSEVFEINGKLFFRIDEAQSNYVKSILMTVTRGDVVQTKRFDIAGMEFDGKYYTMLLSGIVGTRAEKCSIMIAVEGYKNAIISETKGIEYTPYCSAPVLKFLDDGIIITGNSPTFKVAIVEGSATPSDASYASVKNNEADGYAKFKFTFVADKAYNVHIKTSDGAVHTFAYRAPKKPTVQSITSSSDCADIEIQFENDYYEKALYADNGAEIALSQNIESIDKKIITYTVSVDSLRKAFNEGVSALEIRNRVAGLRSLSAPIVVKLDMMQKVEVTAKGNNIEWNWSTRFYGNLKGEGYPQHHSSGISVPESVTGTVILDGRFEPSISITGTSYTIAIPHEGQRLYSFTKCAKPIAYSLSDDRVSPVLVWDNKRVAYGYDVLVEYYNKKTNSYVNISTKGGATVQYKNYYELKSVISTYPSDRYRLTVNTITPGALNSNAMIHDIKLLSDVNIWLSAAQEYTQYINFASENASSSDEYKLFSANMGSGQTFSSNQIDIATYKNRYNNYDRIKALGDGMNTISSVESVLKIVTYELDMAYYNLTARYIGSGSTVSKVYGLVGKPIGVLPYIEDASRKFYIYKWTNSKGEVMNRDTIVKDDVGSNQPLTATEITLGVNQFFINTPKISYYPNIYVGTIGMEIGYIPSYSVGNTFDCWTGVVDSVSTDIRPEKIINSLSQLGFIQDGGRSVRALSLSEKTLSYGTTYSINSGNVYYLSTNYYDIFIGKEATAIALNTTPTTTRTLYIGHNVETLNLGSATYSTITNVVVSKENPYLIEKNGKIYALDGVTILWQPKSTN